MASFTIRDGQIETIAQTVRYNDTGTIESGGRLQASVIWEGGSANPGVTIDNSGAISTFGEARGIDTQGSFTIGSITLNNNSRAVLQASDDAFRINTNIEHGTIIVNNSGLIASENRFFLGQAIDFDALRSPGVHVTISNRGTGLIRSVRSGAIRPGENATINNHGQIIGGEPHLDVPGEDAIDFTAHGGGVVNNFADGSIIGIEHGISSAQSDPANLPAVPASPVEVNNSGMIIAERGSGINLDTTGTSVTHIRNFGLIQGHRDFLFFALPKSGHGVDVHGLVMLENHGSIQVLGPGRIGQLSEGVAIGGGTIINSLGATIFSDERAISVDGSFASTGDNLPAFAATSINNSGAIFGYNGAIKIIGPFNDTIVNNGLIVGTIFTGAGDDTITNNHIGFIVNNISKENNTISNVDSTISTGEGNDTVINKGDILGTISTGAGNDIVDSSIGTSSVVAFGGPGDDKLVGGSNDDELHGDTALGGPPGGNDTLIGGKGNDFLHGDVGNDLLIGGADRDTFVYVPGAPGEGKDIIQDFTPGDDRIELRRFDISTIDTNHNNTIDIGDGPVRTTSTIINGSDTNGLLIDFGNGNTLSVFGADPSGAPLTTLDSLRTGSDLFAIA